MRVGVRLADVCTFCGRGVMGGGGYFEQVCVWGGGGGRRGGGRELIAHSIMVSWFLQSEGIIAGPSLAQ